MGVIHERINYCGVSATALDIVAKSCQTTPEALKSPYRGQAVAYPRFIAMWLLRQAGRSFPEIGRSLNRDHSTCMHGISRVERRRLVEPDYLAATDALRAQFFARTRWRPEPEPTDAELDQIEIAGVP